MVPHDLDDTPAPALHRSQQTTRGILKEQTYTQPSSSSGSLPHSLRRVPRFGDQQRQSRPRSASAESNPRPNVRFADEPDQSAERPSRRRTSSVSRAQDIPAAHPALRISNRTASAILYAVEALRAPNPLTPVAAEENASMSELAGGAAAVSRSSNGRTRGTQGTGPIQSSQPTAPAQTTPVRTPREIMQQRQQRDAAREARRKELEANEAEQRQRRSDEERRRSAERRALAPGGSSQPRDSGYRSATTQGGRTPADLSYDTHGLSSSGGAALATESGQGRYQEDSQSAYDPSRLAPSGVRRPPGVTNNFRGVQPAPEPSRMPTQQPPSAIPSAQAQYSQTRPTDGSGLTSQPARAAQYQPFTASSANDTARGKSSNVNSFPHAFERWETLSSRWEGLTSYWLTRLEQASEDVRRDPTAQQMSRQITDLSAAGANLFHAVVELQRLRASSERKFQRWFFETKAQQEAAQEDRATLQQALENERRAREEDRESGQMSRQASRQTQETRRELQIARDEARRAWEELGRREELERNQVLSLKDGLSISVGGVQVVPHNIPSRGGSLQRPGQEGTYQGQAGVVTPRGVVPGQQEYEEIPQDPSPTETDPFSGSTARVQPGMRIGQVPSYAYDTSQTGRTGVTTGDVRSSQQGTIQNMPQPLPSNIPQMSQAEQQRYYPQQEQYSQESRTRSQGQRAPGQSAFSGSESEEEADYELDDQGNVRFDAGGRPMRYRSTRRRTAQPSGNVSEPSGAQIVQETDDGRTRPGQYRPTADPTRQIPAGLRPAAPAEQPPPAAPMPAPSSQYAERGEYEGEGYGDEEEFDAQQAQQSHHHPTRLSDVPEEEDERSRASASRANRGSGGIF
ncbi:MAG: hypothetical protein M1828_006293 [Chrysothrix sp. TS-e1954]|nr:MAG: hypothetical protein M1828_006293 [Chrysothrix sp. TS-e1954]